MVQFRAWKGVARTLVLLRVDGATEAACLSRGLEFGRDSEGGKSPVGLQAASHLLLVLIVLPCSL